MLCVGGVKLLFPVRINGTFFEKPNYVGRRCVLINAKVGRYTYFGNECEFYNTNIGRFCSIANDVKLIRGQHPTSDFVSVSPLFYQSTTCFGKGFVQCTSFEVNKQCLDGSLCVIGNDVWIGSHVRIMEGVTIGDGAIIGAGALVTRDIPPYSICVGVPAKVMRYRFTKIQIDLLLELQWWNWGIDQIRQEAESFHSIEKFLEDC